MGGGRRGVSKEGPIMLDVAHRLQLSSCLCIGHTASGWVFRSCRLFSSSSISCWKPPMRPANGTSATAFRRIYLVSVVECVDIVVL